MRRFLFVCLAALSLSYSASANENKNWQQYILQSAPVILENIKTQGLDIVLEQADWNFADQVLPIPGSGQSGDPLSECFWNPSAPGCPRPIDQYRPGQGYNYQSQDFSQLKNDALQIIAIEVLDQTLAYFKVKHTFKKSKEPYPAAQWEFKVIDPVPGGQYQDLDTETVVGAIVQFRKFLSGLLCNEPNAKRMLGLVNAFNLGERFRWDMAWALLGNDLPEAPNKYMRFGARWKRFAAAIEGIESSVNLKLRDYEGRQVNLNPGEVQQPSVARKVGFIAREIAGLIRLVGDVFQQLLELFCKSDLSFDKTKEFQKQEIVNRLLEIKKRAYDREGGLYQTLSAMAVEAKRLTNRDISFFP